MSMSASAFQRQFLRIRENKLFEALVITIIVVSALVIGAKTYDMHPTVYRLFTIMDWAITVFFLVEILIRMAAEGGLRAFFRKGWNIFDFVIVTASLIPFDESEMALLGRLLRIFRVLRLVSIIPKLRVLLDAFFRAIPRLGYVSLLMFIIFYIYAAMGSTFFATINQTLWGNISVAMLTLFRVATFEDWTDVMYETMATYPLSWMFYLSFIFMVRLRVSQHDDRHRAANTATGVRARFAGNWRRRSRRGALDPRTHSSDRTAAGPHRTGLHPRRPRRGWRRYSPAALAEPLLSATSGPEPSCD